MHDASQPSPGVFSPTDLPAWVRGPLLVIDVGSNSVQGLIVDFHGALLEEKKFELRLGTLLEPAPAACGFHLPANGVDALSTVIKQVVKWAGDKPHLVRQAACIFAYATSAVRDASNSVQIIDQVAVATGVKIEPITGRQEASLTFQLAADAVRQSQLHPSPTDVFAIVDIGGSSTEVAVGSLLTGQPNRADSWPCGTARLTARLHEKLGENFDHPQAVQVMKALVEAELAGHSIDPVPEGTSVVATSRSVDVLAQLAHADPGASSLSAEQLDLLIEPLPELLQRDGHKLGLSPQRNQQTLAGALILQQMMHRLQVHSVGLCRIGGVREAYLRYGLPMSVIDRVVTTTVNLPDAPVWPEPPSRSGRTDAGPKGRSHEPRHGPRHGPLERKPSVKTRTTHSHPGSVTETQSRQLGGSTRPAGKRPGQRVSPNPSRARQQTA